jgi:hypothetical protein
VTRRIARLPLGACADPDTRAPDVFLLSGAVADVSGRRIRVVHAEDGRRRITVRERR